MTAVAQDAPISRAEYKSLVARIRERVNATVPSDAVVAVVSRGDPNLAELDGREGWHFPQAEGGVYAGHHPADSAEAIASLEALRAKGAGFLLIPGTSFWWFRHYRDFKRHLDRRYWLVAYDEDACLYSLSDRPFEDSGVTDLSPLRRKSLVSQMQDVVESTLPDTAPLLVWMDAPTEPLVLEERRVESFPQSAEGGPLFGVPDGREAIPQLDDLRERGFRYLIVSATAFGLLDQCPSLRLHLEQRHQLAVEQRNLCRIYELCESDVPSQRRLFRRFRHA